MIRRRQSIAPTRRGPSLLGTVARTSVISGTATATSRAVDSAINEKAIKAQQEQATAMQAQQEMEQVKTQLATLQAQQASVAHSTTAATPSAQSELLAQLTQLAQLKEAGALSEEEFRLAKAKLLS